MNDQQRRVFLLERLGRQRRAFAEHLARIEREIAKVSASCTHIDKDGKPSIREGYFGSSCSVCGWSSL